MTAQTTRHKADGEVYNGCVRLTTLVHRSNLTLQTGRPGSMCPLMSCRRKYTCVCVSVLSRVQLFVTPRTVAHQAPLSMGLSRQECWSGLPFTPPEDVPDPGIKPTSPALQADSLLLSHRGRSLESIYPLPWNRAKKWKIRQSSGSNYQFMGKYRRQKN